MDKTELRCIDESLERARIVLSPSTKGGMFAWFNKMRFQKFLSTASDSIREKLGIRTPGIKL